LIAAVASRRITQREARDARREFEASLGERVSDWPWTLPLSRWLDVLVSIEEAR
jgi:hypothetical protein